MALSDVAIKNAKPKDKAYKLYVGDGLLILITPSGGKLWRFKYRFEGKEKVLALGVYPQISLKEARERCFYCRKDLCQGVDPSLKKQIAKSAQMGGGGDSFENVAREWISSRSVLWAGSHTSKILRRLELDVFPWLGKRTISEITPPEILMVMRRIENRGAVDTAHRALQNCGQIFRYAVATGRVERDCTSDLKGALKPTKEGHFAAITDPKKIGAVLQAINDYHGSVVTKCAMRLAPLVFVRPGELRNAEWSEIDFENAQWNIPADRMKMRQPHIVPLSRQLAHAVRDPNGRAYNRTAHLDERKKMMQQWADYLENQSKDKERG